MGDVGYHSNKHGAHQSLLHSHGNWKWHVGSSKNQKSLRTDIPARSGTKNQILWTSTRTKVKPSAISLQPYPNFHFVLRSRYMGVWPTNQVLSNILSSESSFLHPQARCMKPEITVEDGGARDATCDDAFFELWMVVSSSVLFFVLSDSGLRNEDVR